jgi:hypothetical protein
MVRDSAPSVPVIVVMREFDGALGTPIREASRCGWLQEHLSSWACGAADFRLRAPRTSAGRPTHPRELKPSPPLIEASATLPAVSFRHDAADGQTAAGGPRITVGFRIGFN